MWTYPGWPLWADVPPAPHRPPAADLVLARVRHPSFTPELAERLVSELSSRELRRLWKETDELLEQTLEPDARFRLVVLRARLLDRLHPAPGRTSGRG
jgi:hypothetical protein